MIQIFKNPKVDFVGLRFVAYFLSAILVIGGIIGIIQIALGNANLGIDFSGGSVVSLKFKKEIDITKIREILIKNGLPDANIQQISDAYGEPKLKVLLRIKKSNIKVGQLGEYITQIFKTGLAGEEFTIDRIEDIGPVVSKMLKQQAFWAILLAMLGITIYIWFRFEFKFGIAAAIATLHDVFCIIGIFYFLNKEFTLLIVVAILTIAGYSLTDTVVVFDRIRENLKSKFKESLESIINLSVNEVLNRTMMTSITTLLIIVALLILGGEVVHDFSLALFFGVIIGTYSSVFVASPILLEWEKVVLKKQSTK
ncbi:MAG: protein translocase subunit SecF [Candidatus Firestonebacteria bacterium]